MGEGGESISTTSKPLTHGLRFSLTLLRQSGPISGRSDWLRTTGSLSGGSPRSSDSRAIPSPNTANVQAFPSLLRTAHTLQ